MDFTDDPPATSPAGPTEIDVDITGFLPDGVTLGPEGGEPGVDQQPDAAPSAGPVDRFDSTVLDGLEADLGAVDTALLEIDAGRYDGPVWSRIAPSAGLGET